jgi:hypothetical protein
MIFWIYLEEDYLSKSFLFCWTGNETIEINVDYQMEPVVGFDSEPTETLFLQSTQPQMEPISAWSRSSTIGIQFGTAVVPREPCDNNYQDPFAAFDPLSLFSEQEDEEDDVMLLDGDEGNILFDDFLLDQPEDEVGPSEPAELVVTNPCTLAAGSSSTSSSFLALDPELFEKVCNLDTGKSIKNERWDANLFNA